MQIILHLRGYQVCVFRLGGHWHEGLSLNVRVITAHQIHTDQIAGSIVLQFGCQIADQLLVLAGIGKVRGTQLFLSQADLRGEIPTGLIHNLRLYRPFDGTHGEKAQQSRHQRKHQH